MEDEMSVSVSPEGKAVMEDGLGPEDAGNSLPESDNFRTSPGKSSSEGGVLARTKSLGYLGGYRIAPVQTSLKYAELSERQREEITFPPRTFDYLRDDIRQTIIDLINSKISKEIERTVKAPSHRLRVPKPEASSKGNAIEQDCKKGGCLPLANNEGSVVDERRTEVSNPHGNGVSAAKSLETLEKGKNNGVKAECFVLVHNVAKRHNLGTLARSATAFGVSEIILVGRKDFNAFGSHGATLHLQFRHFHTLAEAVQYLKAKDVAICGVEITKGAVGVHTNPFTRSTAFVLGNEGTGLSEKEMEICDFFVYIPQSGPGTASLNVTVAASIVLHQFAVWAGFPEREREGQKYVVAERPVRRGPRNMCPDDPQEVAERRRLKADSAGDDWLLCDTLDDGEDNDNLEVQEVSEDKLSEPTPSKATALGSLNTMFD